MLYVTTRNEKDVYPALRTLGHDRGPEGGVFVPFRMPLFSREELDALKEKSFGCCLAMTLDKLFLPGLDGVELDFSLGRNPVKLRYMNHRIAVAELWHNIRWRFDWIVDELTQRLRVPSQQGLPTTEWAGMAARIAVLFGVFGQLCRAGFTDPDRGMDVVAADADLTMSMAAWYAREMGLPVGNVICCSEKSVVWDLFHHGQLRTSEKLPRDLERLISGRLGADEVNEFLRVCGRRGVYAPDEEKVEWLRRGMYASVISARRTAGTIASVYRNNSYLLGPEAAACVAGLQDHRATAGEGRFALILAQSRPKDDLEAVAAAIGMEPLALKALLD